MISSKYKDLYLSTSNEQAQQLAKLLLAWENEPHNLVVLENLYRLLHSLKGAAATMGYKNTVSLVHAAEDIIDKAYKRQLVADQHVFDLLFETEEVLRKNWQSISKFDKEISLSVLEKELLNAASRSSQDNYLISRSAHTDIQAMTANVPVSAQTLGRLQTSADDMLVNLLSIKNALVNTNDAKALQGYISLENDINNLRHQLEQLRIIPLSSIGNALSLLVRQVARQERKEAVLVIQDNNLSLDKTIVDQLLEILIQLLKNAVSHGVQQRQKKGQIMLRFWLDNDRVFVSVADNGQGIDWQKIRQQAVTHANKKLSDAELKKILFSPRIGASKEATTASGRGVGLSIVKSRIKALGGQIDVESKLGKGTTFIFHFPLPYSVFKGLVWQWGTCRLGLPLSVIQSVSKLPELVSLGDKKNYTDAGEKYQLVDLSKCLHLPALKALSKYLILIKYKGKKFALPVFSNVEELELVMQKTPPVLWGVSCIKGVAVDVQSRPVTVLEINDFEF